MKSVKSWCPLCGTDPVQLSPKAITVTDNRITPDESIYTFTCPECEQEIVHQATTKVLFALAPVGVGTWNVIDKPAELDEKHDGPPLDYEDLCDFLMALASTPDQLILQLAGG